MNNITADRYAEDIAHNDADQAREDFLDHVMGMDQRFNELLDEAAHAARGGGFDSDDISIISAHWRVLQWLAAKVCRDAEVKEGKVHFEKMQEFEEAERSNAA